MKPNSVNILGINYSITYCDNPSDVDLQRRESLWGQIDYWTRTIRLYDGGQPEEEVFRAMLHEVLHGISLELNLVLDDNKYHDDLDVLALALTDVIFRNGWVK